MRNLFKVTLSATMNNSGNITVIARGWNNSNLEKTGSINIAIPRNQVSDGTKITAQTGTKGKNAGGGFTVQVSLNGDDTFVASGTTSATVKYTGLDASSVYDEGFSDAEAQFSSAGSRLWGYTIDNGQHWTAYGSAGMTLYKKG